MYTGRKFNFAGRKNRENVKQNAQDDCLHYANALLNLKTPILSSFEFFPSPWADCCIVANYAQLNTKQILLCILTSHCLDELKYFVTLLFYAKKRKNRENGHAKHSQRTQTKARDLPAQ